jgi:hypothetical protein
MRCPEAKRGTLRRGDPAGKTSRAAGLTLRAAAAMLTERPRRSPGTAFPSPGVSMTIKVGDRLPAGTLQEYYDVEKDGCAIGPNPVTIENLTRGK